MPLSPGQRLGAYEIIDQLGAGGMGEVYRARDARLQRQVAIKIVPAAVAGNEDALERFEREARAVAALSHPNILAIHDFGDQGGVRYAVMELLEGRSLAEILAGGAALPVRKAIEYAKQIADGLAAAHDRGIIHRDIKPGNIFVNNDGRVTILDFGLARIGGPPTTDYSATVAPGTTPGMIIGTIGYMSPEQIRAEGVIDHRSDIFSFGAVLYEMISGKRAFTGATPADTMSGILTTDPDDLSNVHIPPALDRIIRRCLEKEPSRRFQSTRDLGFALDSLSARSESAATVAMPGSMPEPGATRRWRIAAIAALGLLAGAAAGALAMYNRAPAATTMPSTLVRFQITSRLGVPAWVSVSPSGEAVAWGASVAGESNQSVFLRQLNRPTETLVPDSAGSVAGYWRADGRQLLLAKQGQVFSLDPATNVQTPLYDARSDGRIAAFRDASLGENDQLLVGGSQGIVLVDLGNRGAERDVAIPEKGAHLFYGYPQWLPGGRVLFIGVRPDGLVDVFAQPVSGGTPQKINLPADITRVVVDPMGHLLYGRGGALLAQAFDFEALAPKGEPITLSPEVSGERGGVLAVSVGPSNVLAYRTGTQDPVHFEWVDRAGRLISKLGSEAIYTNFDLSPDGTRVVALRRESLSSATSLWLLDSNRQIVSQIAEASGNPATISDPTWSPDGQRLAYRRSNSVVVRNVFGGDEQKVADFRGYPDSWSKDGRYLAVGRPNGPLFELFAIRVDAPQEPIALVTGVTADEPRFSPDGKWVAYHVTTSNVSQVFVMPFPPTGERFQVSTTGGVQPRWRGDGGELFFLDREGNLNGVEMPGGNPRDARPPATLFRTDLDVSPINDQFAVSGDGKRFLIRRAVGGSSQSPVNVVLNWRELLK
jgi:WD40 repeat protein